MINKKNILAIIPARGGSKGVLRKNIKLLGGKPLIAWSILAAKKSQYIDHCIVSTEDKEIADIAKSYGADVPFYRPVCFAEDTANVADVVLYTVNNLKTEYDYIILLQPTSPLRSVDDIDRCIEFFIEKNADSCVSVKKVDNSPYWMYKIEDSKLTPLLTLNKNEFYQRQKLPISYQLNGAIYLMKKTWFLKEKKFISNETLGFVMPAERSVDIDTELDFEIAELIVKGRFLWRKP